MYDFEIVQGVQGGLSSGESNELEATRFYYAKAWLRKESSRGEVVDVS